MQEYRTNPHYDAFIGFGQRSYSLSTSAELGAVIRRDHERFGKLIQAAGIKPQ